LIVGAGPAGLAAAIELRRLGAGQVVVAEREVAAGGVPRLCGHTGFGLRDLRRLLDGPAYAARYRQAAQAAGVEVRTSTTITGWAAPNNGATALTYTSPRGLGQIEARAVLLATGCRERPRAARLVPGTRPQGVLTTGALQRFVYEQHLPVGTRAVIVGAELVSLSALMTLQHAGVRAALMVTELPRHQIFWPYLPMKWLLADGLGRTPIVTGARVSNIVGRERVEAVELTHLDTGQTETVPCDTVIFTGDWVPEHETARLGGLMMDGGTRGPAVDSGYHTSRPGVFAAGNLLHGAETADVCALEGRDAAWWIFDYLYGDAWPVPRLPIIAEPPLAWVCPSVIAPVPLVAHLFRSLEFRENALVEVRQGDQLLFRQRFPQLIVNESMRLPGGWAKHAQPGGEPIRLVVVQ
jgi:NADPH-dependent 2,4-dienoyl-CoA reductase/sulfur reductase-like enzyme